MPENVLGHSVPIFYNQQYLSKRLVSYHVDFFLDVVLVTFLAVALLFFFFTIPSNFYFRFIFFFFIAFQF